MKTIDLQPYDPPVPLLGPVPPRWFAERCDKCTFSPDGIPGVVDWSAACILHDWAYQPFSGVTRWQADWYLMRNMITLGCPPAIAMRY